jgi:acetoin utilization protein AcuB
VGSGNPAVVQVPTLPVRRAHDALCASGSRTDLEETLVTLLDASSISPVTVRESTTIGQAWELLRTLDIRHLPVVNGEGELVGIVGDRDFASPPAPPLMTDLLGARAESLDAPVSTIMTGEPISVDYGVEVEDAIDLMVENKVGAIPVVGPEGEVVGIVSYLDILRAMRDRPGVAEVS